MQLANYSRPEIELAVSVLIDLLDSMDVDSDYEPDSDDEPDADAEPDNEDCCAAGDDLGNARAVIAEGRGYGLEFHPGDDGYYVDYRGQRHRLDDLDFWRRLNRVRHDDINAVLIAERA